METDFVFHDPSGNRWLRVRRAAYVAAVLLGVIGALLTVALVTNPQLPALAMGTVAHLGDRSEVRTIIGSEHAAKNIPFKKDVRYVKSLSPVIHQKTAARERSDHPLVFGYYVNWDPASIVSLRINLNHLTHLVPEWLTLANGNGDLSDESDQTVIKIADDAHLPILAMVTNFRAGWQADDLHNVLSDPQHRADLVRNIHANLTEHKFAGVNIDFEELRERDRGLLVGFMKELRAELKPDGFLVSEAVPADDPAYDLKHLAELNDYIVPMVYDEHYQSGTPGPVASQDWFETQLERLAKKLPAEKTVIGFGGYGYDWVIGARGSTEVTFGDIIAAAGQNKAKSSGTKMPKTRCCDTSAAEEQHEVWFLDAVTAVNEFQAIGDTGFRGMALWRLGAEDPGVWTVLKIESVAR